jgi:hypothetical protein
MALEPAGRQEFEAAPPDGSARETAAAVARLDIL